MTINKVYVIDQAMSSGMFSVQYQLMLNDYFNGFLTGTSNLNYYDTTKQYLGLLEMFLSPEKQIQFSRVTNKLRMHTDWSVYRTGDKLMAECMVAINPETYPEIYNDILLKRYVTALIKRQWAANLSKFSNIALPGGMKFDAPQMYGDATTELSQIEDTVQSKYELPVDFMVG